MAQGEDIDRDAIEAEDVGPDDVQPEAGQQAEQGSKRALSVAEHNVEALTTGFGRIRPGRPGPKDLRGARVCVGGGSVRVGWDDMRGTRSRKTLREDTRNVRERTRCSSANLACVVLSKEFATVE